MFAAGSFPLGMPVVEDKVFPWLQPSAGMISRLQSAPEMSRAPPSPPGSPAPVPCAVPGAFLPQCWLQGSQTSPPPPRADPGIFHVSAQLSVSCCFSFPIVWSRAFPHLGQEGGEDFPPSAELYQSGASFQPSPARAWLVSGAVQSTGSAGRGLECWFGHRAPWHRACGLPCHPKILWSRGLCCKERKGICKDNSLVQGRLSTSLCCSSVFPGLASPGAQHIHVQGM